MESDLLYSKERLAVERKAQHDLKPLTGDGPGAAWAHMRQRLSRAEREARAARRLTIALFSVSLAGLAGVIMVARPWSAAIGTRASAGEAHVRAGDSQDLLLIRTGPSPASRVPDRTPSPLFGSSASPGPPPGRPSGSISPGLVSPGITPETRPSTRGAGGERSAGKPGVAASSGRSEGSPRSETNVGPRVGGG